MSLKGYGSRGAGGNSIRGRVENDFYATDKKDTRNFLEAIQKDGIDISEFTMLEPCAGAGHIVDVLKEYYPEAQIDYSDIVSRREDVKGNIDFLKEKIGKYDIVITNPPFKYAKEFVNKSLEISNKYVMIFAKLSFLEGKGRVDWWKELPLKYVYVYSYRASPLRNGKDRDEKGKKWSSTMAFAWYMFEQGYEGEPTIRWIKDKEL